MMGAEGLSRCYSQGVGVPMDFHLSAIYLKEAAESTVDAWTRCGGKALALYNYGVMCHKSIACQGDNNHAVAKEYLKRSAALGCDAAIKHLESTAKDRKMVLSFNSYEGIFAAEQNPEKADFQFRAYSIFAGGCHDSDGKICIERDRDRSMIFLHKAANLGHAEARKELETEYARLSPDMVTNLRGEILLASPWLEGLPMRTEEEVLAAANEAGADPATIWLAAVVHYRRFMTVAKNNKQEGFEELASAMIRYVAWSANCGRVEARALVRQLSTSSLVTGHFKRACLAWLVPPAEIVAKAEAVSAAAAAAATAESEASALELSAAAAAAASAAESTPGDIYLHAWQVLCGSRAEKQSDYPAAERVAQDIHRGLDFLCLSANKGHSQGKTACRTVWRGLLPSVDADHKDGEVLADMRERIARLSPWLALEEDGEEAGAAQEAEGAEAAGLV